MRSCILTLGLMMPLMMPLREVSSQSTGVFSTVSSSIIYINRFIESYYNMLESDIKVDRSGDPATPWSKWLKGTDTVEIPYYLSAFTSREQSKINSALRSIESKTCIFFKQLSLSDMLKTRPHLYIYPGVGCWSYIGMKWNLRYQYLSLSRYGCLTEPIIQHVIMHALGFTHEQSRPDRDNYVNVYFDNIHPKKRHFFNKYGTSNQVTAYDYNSIMHYDRYAYTKNGASRNDADQTLQPKQKADKLGTATQMSPLDFQKINRFYDCKKYL